tara:strand:+ start:3508 stop:6267 length:2760 start_codon:yes stop_codon:yes gene_type:complete
MIVQLILFPQNFKGANAPLSDPPREFIVGNSASSFGGTQYLNNIVAIGQPKVQNALTWFNAASYPPNTWGRYGRVMNQFYLNFNGPCPSFMQFKNLQCGLYQKLSGLTVGDLYNVDVGIVSALTFPTCGSTNSQGTWKVYHCTGNTINSVHTIVGLDIQSHQFTAVSTDDILIFDWENPIPFDFATQSPQGALYSISVTNQTTINNYGNFVANGQVICDLYEDEDIPMTFSVDDFKNVAESVQSYSKAFKLPATSRNNRIFGQIFDVTRDTYTGGLFNPYQKTEAILKQDGFVLFEGYLRLIDIVDQDGEISYNVNLYSETIALKDLLKERVFSDLDFSELRHDYNKTSIKNSWYDTTGLPLQNPLPTTSYAYEAALGVNNTNVLKYPFVDWAHEYAVQSGTGYPQLLNLDNTFRPWLQIKYLINKIFEFTPFTWSSNFFNTTDFEKLFMDFNWASRPITSGYAEMTETLRCTNGGWMPVFFDSINFPQEAGFDSSTYIFTAPVDNTSYNISWHIRARNSFGNPNTQFDWLHRDASGTIINSQWVTPMFSNTLNFIQPSWQSSQQFLLQQGETIEFRIKQSSVGGTFCNCQSTTEMTVVMNQQIVGSDVLAQTLRGDLNQWEFLKGIMTMFNLISIADKDDSSNIIFEPYGDIFIKNTNSGTTSDLSLASRGISRDWTDKIDISEMKLAPLTNLNKTTEFVWEIDKDDYFYNLYSTSVNHPYGSLTFDASGFNILEGKEEISGKPFAATLSKPIMSNFPQMVVPTIYQVAEDGTSKGFENLPRICYNNGIVNLGHTYYIPAQNGLSSENQPNFLQFSHLSDIPTTANSLDFLWGEQQYSSAQMGATTVNNLFNLYYRPYFNELYNADTKIMTIKVNLTPSDIATFNLYDTVFIKQREYRVNKINYKPNDLAEVEFILIV